MNEYHVRLATNMAKKSVSKFRLGAVLARKNRVISTGFNAMHKTHTIMQKYNVDKSWAPGLHAEVHACIGVPAADLFGSDLYVARILKNGEVAMAKPCVICQKFLNDVGIRRVYYTNQQGKVEMLWER